MSIAIFLCSTIDCRGKGNSSQHKCFVFSASRCSRLKFPRQYCGICGGVVSRVNGSQSVTLKFPRSISGTNFDYISQIELSSNILKFIFSSEPKIIQCYKTLKQDILELSLPRETHKLQNFNQPCLLWKCKGYLEMHFVQQEFQQQQNICTLHNIIL